MDSACVDLGSHRVNVFRVFLGAQPWVKACGTSNFPKLNHALQIASCLFLVNQDFAVSQDMEDVPPNRTAARHSGYFDILGQALTQANYTAVAYDQVTWKKHCLLG